MVAARQNPVAVTRVAVVSDSLPARNGVGAYYLDLLDQLADDEFETELICPRNARDGLRFPLPGDSTQRIWVPSPARFRRELKRLRPHCMVVATPGPYGQLGAWWANHLGIELIVGFHTDYAGVTDLYSNPLLRGFSRFYFSIADRMLFRRADLVLGNSAPMLDTAASLGARKTDLMGTLVPKTSLAAPVANAMETLGHVLFAGRLAVEKNIQQVLDAAAELPAVRFTIAGEGPLRDSVVDQATRLDNVSYLGWVDRDALLAAMDSADMLVLPSSLESFGTVALEAMARQRLALVSSACGILDWPDLAPHLYRIGENRTVADAIRDIAALEPAARREKAAAARQAALRLNAQSLDEWRQLLAGTHD